jgi:hypothetical protein
MLRALVGDTSSTPLEPAIEGQANYAVWSDLALEAALGLASGSIYRAAANLYFSLAAQYAQQGRSTKTDDLTLDTKGRAGDLITIARAWAAHADGGDVAAANDFFQIVGFTPLHDCEPFSPYAPSRPFTPASPAPALDPNGYGW